MTELSPWKVYQFPFRYTVDSRCLEIQKTVWNTSRLRTSEARHIRFAELTKKIIKSNDHISQMNMYLDMLQILWKRGEIAPLFHSCLLLGDRFSYLNKNQTFASR